MSGAVMWWSGLFFNTAGGSSLYSDPENPTQFRRHRIIVMSACGALPESQIMECDKYFGT